MEKINRIELRLAISRLEKQKPKNLGEFEFIEGEINRLMNLLRDLTGV